MMSCGDGGGILVVNQHVPHDRTTLTPPHLDPFSTAEIWQVSLPVAEFSCSLEPTNVIDIKLLIPSQPIVEFLQKRKIN